MNIAEELLANPTIRKMASYALAEEIIIKGKTHLTLDQVAQLIQTVLADYATFEAGQPLTVSIPQESVDLGAAIGKVAVSAVLTFKKA